MNFLNRVLTINQDFLGMGIGDWGLGIGDWAQSPIPNPQSPRIYISIIFSTYQKQILINQIFLINKII